MSMMQKRRPSMAVIVTRLRPAPAAGPPPAPSVPGPLLHIYEVHPNSTAQVHDANPGINDAASYEQRAHDTPDVDYGVVA